MLKKSPSGSLCPYYYIELIDKVLKILILFMETSSMVL